MAVNPDFSIYIMSIIETFLQFYFLTKILKKKIRSPLYFLPAVCVVIVNDFLPVTTLIGFTAFVFLLTVCAVFACHAEVKYSLLYAALTTEIMLLCSGIVNSLIYLLCSRMPAVCPDTDGIAFILANETALLLLTGFCYYMVYRYFSVDALYPRDTPYSIHTAGETQQMFLVFIPILMIFIMSQYINAVQFEFLFEDLVYEGPAGPLFSHGQLFAMHLLGLLSLFCILFSYKKLQQNFQLSTKISLLEQEEHSLDQYVEEAKARYDDTRSFRHDIKNHIAVVKNLLQSGKLKEAVSYIEDLDDMAEKMSFPCSTNNPVVDILVGNKLGIAKSMGIRVDCSLRLPYPCGLRDIDICIVLSNALDNAIQACKNVTADPLSGGSPPAPSGACITGYPRYIQVSGRIQGDFLMMEVKNSFQGKEMFKKGTGLSNIKAVAEKYGGAMSIETQGNVFALQVLLIIPQHSECISRQMD